MPTGRSVTQVKQKSRRLATERAPISPTKRDPLLLQGLVKVMKQCLLRPYSSVFRPFRRLTWAVCQTYYDLDVSVAHRCSRFRCSASSLACDVARFETSPQHQSPGGDAVHEESLEELSAPEASSCSPGGVASAASQHVMKRRACVLFSHTQESSLKPSRRDRCRGKAKASSFRS